MLYINCATVFHLVYLSPVLALYNYYATTADNNTNTSNWKFPVSQHFIPIYFSTFLFLKLELYLGKKE